MDDRFTTLTDLTATILELAGEEASDYRQDILGEFHGTTSTTSSGCCGAGGSSWWSTPNR